MLTDKKVIEKLERKAKHHNEEKERKISSFESELAAAREALDDLEERFREGVEKEYGENLCEKLLERIKMGDEPTEDEIRAALAAETPHGSESLESWSLSLAGGLEAFKTRVVGREEGITKIIAGPDGGQWDCAKTAGFGECCAWKECSWHAIEKRTYSVDRKNPRIVTKIGDGQCTVIGNTHLPANKVTSWSIKILNSKNNDGNSIFVGVVPFSIDQNKGYNHAKCGWHFGCYESKLWSGPPCDYLSREYGPRKKREGKYVRNGDSIGVVMDAARGDISFVVNGVNLGVAYEKIPLDKPLVPCVLLENEGDSIELDTTEVKENVDISIPVPSNITHRAVSTQNSISIRWDVVEGASFYQIEVDGSKSWELSTINIFTLRGIPPESEHAFRVRVVRGNSVSVWSEVVKERAHK